MMETKDILHLLDITLPEGEELTTDKVQAAMAEKWIARDLVFTDEKIVDKIAGKKLGELETALKRELKAIGKTIGLPDEDINGFKISSLKDDENAMTKIKATITSKLEEMKSAPAGDGGKAAKELEGKLELVNGQLSNYKSMLKEKADELDLFKTSAEKEKRTWLLNQQKADAFSKFTLSELVDPLKRRGFDVYFEDKYELDLSEENKVLIKDKSSGQLVQNKKKTGFATLEEVYREELEANKMLKANGTPSTTAARPEPYIFKADTGADNGKVPIGMAAALRHAEQLKQQAKEQ